MTSGTHERWFETVGRTKVLQASVGYMRVFMPLWCLELKHHRWQVAFWQQICGRQIPVEVDRLGTRLSCWFGQVRFTTRQVNLKLDSLATLCLRIAWHQRRPGGNKHFVQWKWHTKQSSSLKDLTRRCRKAIFIVANGNNNNHNLCSTYLWLLWMVDWPPHARLKVSFRRLPSAILRLFFKIFPSLSPTFFGRYEEDSAGFWVRLCLALGTSPSRCHTWLPSWHGNISKQVQGEPNIVQSFGWIA